MNFDAQGIKDFLLLVAGLMVIVSGIFIAIKAKNGEVRESLAVALGILIAAIVIAAGSHLKEIGDWGFNLFF